MVHFCILMFGHLSSHVPSHVTVPGYGVVDLNTVYNTQTLFIDLKISLGCLTGNMLPKLEIKMQKEQEIQRCKELKVSPANHSLILVSAHLKNKGTLTIPNDTPIQPIVEEYEGGQGKEEIDIEDLYNGLKIVEQSELNYFNAILQKAQKLTMKAQGERPQKHSRRYDGKSKRTLKRHKN